MEPKWIAGKAIYAQQALLHQWLPARQSRCVDRSPRRAERRSDSSLHPSGIPASGCSPRVATEPPLPEDVPTNDELFLTGLHLEQYRHPTRYPEFYWREGLRRDPEDSRINHAIGRWHLRRGEFQEAEAHLRAALKRLLLRNPNPYDGEPLYHLGLTLQFQNRLVEAYDSFYKSTWNAAWRGPGYLRLAEIDCTRKDWTKALDHLDRSLCSDADNLNALNLKVLVLRALGRPGDLRSPF